MKQEEEEDLKIWQENLDHYEIVSFDFFCFFVFLLFTNIDSHLHQL